MTVSASPYINFRNSYDRLKDAQKTRKGVSLYSTYVNRPIGRILAAGFHQTRISPNQVTGIGALITFGSLLWMAFFARGGISVAGIAVCLVLGFAIDSADGQLARLQGSSSQLGEWLDHILDNARIGVMHLSTLAFLTRVTGIDLKILMLICGLFLVSSASMFFGGVLTEQFAKRGTENGATGRAPATSSRLRSMALLPVDYGITCLSYLLLPWPQTFVIVYASLAAIHCVVLPVLAAKWARGLKAGY